MRCLEPSEEHLLNIRVLHCLKSLSLRIHDLFLVADDAVTIFSIVESVLAGIPKSAAVFFFFDNGALSTAFMISAFLSRLRDCFLNPLMSETGFALNN